MIEEGHPLKPKRKEIARLLAYLKGEYALQFAMQEIYKDYGSDAVLKLDYWICQLILDSESETAIVPKVAPPLRRHMQQAPSDVIARLTSERSDNENDT